MCTTSSVIMKVLLFGPAKSIIGKESIDVQIKDIKQEEEKEKEKGYSFSSLTGVKQGEERKRRTIKSSPSLQQRCCEITDLLYAINIQFPALTPLLPQCVVAVDHRYVSTSYIVSQGQEVALIPPINGG